MKLWKYCIAIKCTQLNTLSQIPAYHEMNEKSITNSAVTYVNNFKLNKSMKKTGYTVSTVDV